MFHKKSTDQKSLLHRSLLFHYRYGNNTLKFLLLLSLTLLCVCLLGREIHIYLSFNSFTYKFLYLFAHLVTRAFTLISLFFPYSYVGVYVLRSLGSCSQRFQNLLTILKGYRKGESGSHECFLFYIFPLMVLRPDKATKTGLKTNTKIYQLLRMPL